MKRILSCVEILDEGDVRALHQATLEVLSTVGCRLPHERVLRMMRGAGAKVDEGTATVRLPPELVERSIAHAVGAEAGQTGRPRFAQPAFIRRSGFRVGLSTQANMIDYHARSRRQGTTEDVLKGIALCNALPHVRSCMPLVTPADVPSHVADLYGYSLCTVYSTKPYGVYILSPETARQILRIWELVREEPARAGDRPRLSYLLEPNGSLSYDEFSLEMALIFADAGHRIHVGPMAMAGLDAPVTLAGTLVIQNADNLIGVVLCDLLGLPGTWSGSAHTLDLRHALCSFGSPNQVLLGWAAIQLGRSYGFEVTVNSALTDACVPDFQGGFEKGMSGMAALLAGAAGVGAQGLVGADQGASLEQLVVDDEWASAIDHIFGLGFEVNEETLALDTIRQVGIGGNYLAEDHTVRHMRETYWPATVFNQKSWDAWMADGGHDVYARAHEKVERILAEHYPPPPLLSPEVREKLDALVEGARSHPELFVPERYRAEERA
ncbi:MAG: trimethylamine methyltransferase family protein [Anaerolineae bacterium]|nr:trimethylamine methyltransferase family protein [Anaerolineae bacterium]